MAKRLYSYRGDLPKSLFKITAQVCKKSTSEVDVRRSKTSLLKLSFAEHKRTDVSHLIEYKYINKALNHFVISPCSQTIYSETIVPDPDLEIRGRGAGRSPKKLFSALHASVWSKNKGDTGPRPLIYFLLRLVERA